MTLCVFTADSVLIPAHTACHIKHAGYQTLQSSDGCTALSSWLLLLDANTYVGLLCSLNRRIIRSLFWAQQTCSLLGLCILQLQNQDSGDPRLRLWVKHITAKLPANINTSGT
uniref:Uncharacterized protein n=1 Tax=Poecilia reticulata TaxID=8081 RepID=A0A3P9N5Z4_POERE